MSFPLIGNARLRKTVDAMLRSGSVPHALLLEGEPGLGRHTLAAYLANALVCSGGERPCGVCRNCLVAAAGNHPDIAAVAPEGKKKSITVDQIRSLRQQAFVQPHMAQHRVFLIDPADSMNEQAQNALLKILEEPPGGVVFLLIAQSRTALLDTVVSRCTPLTLAVPAQDEAAACLAERLHIPKPEAVAALSACGGNPGRAIERLTGQIGDRVVAAAQELLELLLAGREYDALRLLAPFEKDRAGAEALFSALRTEIAGKMRERHISRTYARLLNRLYEQMLSYDALLETNINLSLLFSAAVCRAVQLRNII